METNLEKAKRQLKDNAAINGFDLPDDGFLMKMLELAATPDENEWIEFEGNENIFGDYSLLNCLCKFDNGMVCRYNDYHPMAVLTHFKL